MKEIFLTYMNENAEAMIKAAVAILVIALTYISVRIFRRYVTNTAEKHHFAEHRTVNITKTGKAIIYFISLIIISNVLGFGIQGVFIATSSFFAIVGIAFFAVWSILSNVTASILLYFTFPYRLGDRILIEGEPKYCGKLKDVTLMYLRIQTNTDSYITLPANVAIQKIITILSEEDYQKLLAEKENPKDADAS